jgi:hypothetical protein
VSCSEFTTGEDNIQNTPFRRFALIMILPIGLLHSRSPLYRLEYICKLRYLSVVQRHLETESRSLSEATMLKTLALSTDYTQTLFWQLAKTLCKLSLIPTYVADGIVSGPYCLRRGNCSFQLLRLATRGYGHGILTLRECTRICFESAALCMWRRRLGVWAKRGHRLSRIWPRATVRQQGQMHTCSSSCSLTAYIKYCLQPLSPSTVLVCLFSCRRSLSGQTVTASRPYPRRRVQLTGRLRSSPLLIADANTITLPLPKLNSNDVRVMMSQRGGQSRRLGGPRTANISCSKSVRFRHGIDLGKASVNSVEHGE